MQEEEEERIYTTGVNNLIEDTKTEIKSERK